MLASALLPLVEQQQNGQGDQLPKARSRSGPQSRQKYRQDNGENQIEKQAQQYF